MDPLKFWGVLKTKPIVFINRRPSDTKTNFFYPARDCQILAILSTGKNTKQINEVAVIKINL